MNLDFNKIKAGMVIPAALGIVLVLAGFVFTLIFGIFSSVSFMAQILDILAGIAGLLISLIIYALFLALFFWAGYRTARKYHGDVVESGVTAALAYTVVALVNLVLTGLLYILSLVGILSITAISSGIGGEVSDIGVAFLPGDAASALGIIENICCALGLLPLGALINFVVGALGGMLGEKK